jgi:hypothetical protein
MKHVLDQLELQALQSAGDGFVYNDYAGTSASGRYHNILHAARCSWILRSDAKIQKIWFADLAEALAWLTTNRGPEGVGWKRCGSCCP